MSRLRDFKERVRGAYSIIDAVRDEGVTLKMRNGSYSACCPFHAEKSPSFNVNPERGTYKCFGAGCEVGGDVFSFLQDIHDISFSEALRLAADRAGIDASEVFSSPAPAQRARPKRSISERLGDHTVNSVPEGIRKPFVSYLQGDVKRPFAGRPFTLWKPNVESVKTYRAIEMIHDYKDVDGTYLMSILRISFPDRDTGKRKKVFIPARYAAAPASVDASAQPRQAADGTTHAWIAQSHASPEAKPVYGMERSRAAFLGDEVQILIVEGEKTCDAADRLVNDQSWLVVSPQGGGKAAHLGWWKPLVDLMRDNPDKMVNVVVWPDADNKLERRDGSFETADARRAIFGRQVTAVLRCWLKREGVNYENVNFANLLPPSDKNDAWDLADAEKEGWTGDDVMAFVKNNSTPAIDDIDTRNDSMTDPEVSASPDPFEQAADEMGDESRLSADDFEAEMGGFLNAETTASAAQTGAIGDDPDQFRDGVDIAHTDEDGDGDGDGSGDDDDLRPTPEGRIANNRFFRPLGNSEGMCYFFSKRSCHIIAVKLESVTKNILFALAPEEFWLALYPRLAPNQTVAGVQYDTAISSLVSASYDAGYWTRENEVRKGARIDGGRVVFNTGSSLYVVGEGRRGLSDFTGEYTYTSGGRVSSPDFENPFTKDSPEIREMISIIRNISWRDEMMELCVMSLLGWIVTGPVCGAIPHRPHIWIDGPRSSGKSWIIRNVVAKTLGDYCLNLVSSTEPGIRRTLNACFIPAIYDEAEADKNSKSTRIKDIIGLSRVASSNDKSMIVQADTAGGTMKFEICSTFMMSSITPQLDDAADQSRYARIHLGSPKTGARFEDLIENPSRKLFTPEFSSRLIARMIMRAGDFDKASKVMVRAFTSLMRTEKRTADVYGAFAAGAWLLLRDGVPEDTDEALEFMNVEFGIGMTSQMDRITENINEERDHLKLIRRLISEPLRFDTPNAGMRSERIGVLMQIAIGLPTDDTMISQEEACAVLSSNDIRLGIEDAVCKPSDVPTHVLVHSKSEVLKKILENTSYASGYADVIKQAGNVKTGKNTTHFRGSGKSKPLVIPVENFPI